MNKIIQQVENIVVLTDRQILEEEPSTTNDLHEQIDTHVDVIISENELYLHI